MATTAPNSVEMIASDAEHDGHSDEIDGHARHPWDQQPSLSNPVEQA